MSILIKLLLGLLGIVALILIAALFTKKDIKAEREVVINKPKQVVFDYIRYLKNQDNYSKWAKMDPAMKKSYSGTDGTVGFVSAWDSDKKDVGKGEQEIKKITEGERIDLEVRFIKPFPSTAPCFLSTEAIDSNHTKVKWGFSGKMNYPMNAFMWIQDINGMVGKDLQTGLDNLKVLLEK